jgi:hypothetical protein
LMLSYLFATCYTTFTLDRVTRPKRGREEGGKVGGERERERERGRGKGEKRGKQNGGVKNEKRQRKIVDKEK